MALWIVTIAVTVLVNFPAFWRRVLDYLWRLLVNRIVQPRVKLAGRSQPSASSQTVDSSFGSFLEMTATSETTASKEELPLDAAAGSLLRNDSRKSVRFGSLSRIEEKIADDSDREQKDTNRKNEQHNLPLQPGYSGQTFLSETGQALQPLNNRPETSASHSQLDSMRSRKGSAVRQRAEITSATKSSAMSLPRTEFPDSTSILQGEEQTISSVPSVRQGSIQSVQSESRREDALPSTCDSTGSVNTDVSKRRDHSDLSNRLRMRLTQGHKLTVKPKRTPSRPNKAGSNKTLQTSSPPTLPDTKLPVDRRRATSAFPLV
jgi:hypothetical protein